MHQEILNCFREITPEEHAILDWKADIDWDIYMQEKSNTINAKKLLSAGKLITMRPHTRFIHFPEHTHDYIEVVYMCAGQSTHIVNGNRVQLTQGELLFMNQCATHEIEKTSETDIAVNFIILPEFFNTVLFFVGEAETPLRRFLVDCLCGQRCDGGFLHFRVAEITPIQNLVENLLFTLLKETPSKRKMSEMTMVLLFMQIMDHTDAIYSSNLEQTTVFKVLSYIESHYASGSLSELAELLHYNVYSLSREIKQKTGKNYTELVQEKRLAQVAFLLKNTDGNVDSIANAVGYENIGYFYRIFQEKFGISPRKYRLQIK